MCTFHTKYTMKTRHTGQRTNETGSHFLVSTVFVRNRSFNSQRKGNKNNSKNRPFRPENALGGPRCLDWYPYANKPPTSRFVHSKQRKGSSNPGTSQPSMAYPGFREQISLCSGVRRVQHPSRHWEKSCQPAADGEAKKGSSHCVCVCLHSQIGRQTECKHSLSSGPGK